MPVIRCIADFASYLVQNSILDIFLVLAFTISQVTSQFVDKLPSHAESAVTHRSCRARTTEDCLKKYDLLLQISIQLDGTLSTLFKAMHIYNMFLAIYFTHEFFHGHKNGTFVLFAIQVTKAALGYYYAVKVANKVRYCLKYGRILLNAYR